MKLIPLYHSGFRVLVALDADFKELPVKDSLGVMLDLKEAEIIRGAWSLQSILKGGYWESIAKENCDSWLEKITAIFGREQTEKIIEMLLNPAREEIESLGWIPERLKTPQARVISLDSWRKGRSDYEAVLKDTLEELEAMQSRLYDLMVNLAMAGKWKEWSRSKPIGTVFNFTEEMLKDTGDKNVDALAVLMDELICVRKSLNEN